MNPSPATHPWTDPIPQPVTRLGLQLADFSFPGVGDREFLAPVAQLARATEQSGFDSLWLMDHFEQIPYLGAPTDPMPEAYTLLGALAAVTSSISLGVLVTGVTHRHPAVVAKQATTLDVISGGRAILGLGAAWHGEEHARLGIEFPSLPERLERLEDALRICKAMFVHDRATVAGRHTSTNGALNYPRPIRPGGIPILVGGGGERVTLRLVAKYGDACNLFGDVATIRRKLAVLDHHCEQIGRDPATVTRTRLGPLLIGSTPPLAKAAAAAYREHHGIDEAAFKANVVSGTPEEVRDQVGSLLEAGLDGMIFYIPGLHEASQIRMAGEALAPLIQTRSS